MKSISQITLWQFATALFNCGQLQTSFQSWVIWNSSFEILVHLEMSWSTTLSLFKFG